MNYRLQFFSAGTHLQFFYAQHISTGTTNFFDLPPWYQLQHSAVCIRNQIVTIEMDKFALFHSFITGPPRQARFGPCLDFGFQYALIRNNRSKNLG